MVGERVLVVPSKEIRFTGVSQADLRKLHDIISAHGRFMDRDVAEKDEAWRQIISYVVFTCDGKVMSYRRGKGSNETRLRELRSIGIGGHVNPVPGHEEAVLTAITLGREHELDEEVSIYTRVVSDKLVALLADNNTPVGRVHLGMIYHYVLTNPIVKSREPDKIQDIRWDAAGLLLDMHGAGDCVLESWSRILLEANLL